LNAPGGADFEMDDTAISFINVCYDRNKDRARHSPGGESPLDPAFQEQDPSALGPFTAILPQGTTTAVTGSLKGKKTLLMLLGRFMLPTDGIISYPDNLRVRFIHGEPMMLQGTVMDNLLFGNKKNHPEEEIITVASLCGLSKRLCLNPHTDIGDGGNKLSLTEKISVCVARALLSSVDLLLLAGTLDVLTFAHAEDILDLIGRWVHDRGMQCLSAESTGPNVLLKKKKTCVYVTNTKGLDAKADLVMKLVKLDDGADLRAKDEEIRQLKAKLAAIDPQANDSNRNNSREPITTPPVLNEHLISDYFDRYDINANGVIDSQTELEQLVTNIVFKIDLKIQNTTLVEVVAKRAETICDSPLTKESFKVWFENELLPWADPGY